MRIRSIGLWIGAIAAIAPMVKGAQDGVKIADIPVADTFLPPIGSRAASASDLVSASINGLFDSITYPDKFKAFKDPGRCSGTTDTDITAWYIYTGFAQNVTKDQQLYNAKGDYHPGEDWNAKGERTADACQPVFSMAAGVVLRVGSLSNFGNAVLIVHRLRNKDELVLSVYGHLKTTAGISQGAVVNSTTQIGTVGDSGTYRDNYHLHWEIRKQSFVSVDDNMVVHLKPDVDKEPFRPSRWPATGTDDNGKAFIGENYYSPSDFIKSKSSAGDIYNHPHDNRVTVPTTGFAATDLGEPCGFGCEYTGKLNIRIRQLTIWLQEVVIPTHSTVPQPEDPVIGIATSIPWAWHNKVCSFPLKWADLRVGKNVITVPDGVDCTIKEKGSYSVSITPSNYPSYYLMPATYFENGNWHSFAVLSSNIF